MDNLFKFKHMIDSQQKKKVQTSLKKASSLLVKINQMVEKDCYCIDVMQQNLAVIGLLRSAHTLLMQNHLNTCFRLAMSSKDEKKKQAMITEILKVTNLRNK